MINLQAARGVEPVIANQRNYSLIPPTVEVLTSIGSRYLTENIKLYAHDLHSPHEHMRVYGQLGLFLTITGIISMLVIDRMDNNLHYTKGMLAVTGAINLMKTISLGIGNLIKEDEHIGIYAGIISAMMAIGILSLFYRRIP